MARSRRLLPWAVALAAGGCRLGATTPPPDAVPTPAPPVDSTTATPDVDSVMATSDLPDLIEAPLPDDPMAVTIHRLSNGMTVYISTERLKPRFSAWIGVRAGSRMDPPDSTGLAHYLEHMLFKGTDEYGTLDAKKEAPHVKRVAELYDQLRATDKPAERKKILAEIDAETQKMSQYAVPNEHSRMYSTMGVEGINAFTSFEQTVYIGDVPSNRLEAWATVEGERFTDPVFRLFFTELEAVYEEKNLSIDNPGRQVREALYTALFPEHPYGTQTTIGESEHLKNPAYGDMVDYFGRWYVPNNMAVVLSGDIDAETALPVLEKTLGGLKPKPVPEPHAGKITPLSGRVFREVRADGEEEVTLSWHIPEIGHPDLVALEVMDRVLDDARVGLINVELELTQKVPSAGSYTSTLREAGHYVMWAEARAGQDPKELETMLLGVIDKLKKGDFSEQDVTAAKLQHEVSRKFRLEFPWSRTSQMMDAFIQHRQWADVVADEKRFQKVTREDVIRVANQYLTGNYVVIAKRKGKPEIPKLDKPDITPVKIDPSRKSEFAKGIEAMPASELRPEWVVEGKHYARRSLPAGDLISAKNTRNDLFSLTYRQKRGYRKAPYLCYALELLELSGAGDDDAEALQKQLYALGASIYTSCNAEYSSITVQGPESQLEASLAILDRWLASPRFDKEVLARLHKNTVSERRDGMEKDWMLTSALNDFAKYGKRSSWLQQPSNKMLERAKPAMLTKLITTFFDHEHTTMYFGARGPDDIAKVVARGEKHKKTGDVQLRKYQKVKKPTIVFLHKDGAKANVRFTIPRDPLPREMRPTAELLSEYLSGNMSALVFQEIRESRGLAYSAYSNYSTGTRPKDESSLAGFMSTQADKTPEAVRTFLGLLRSDDIQPERLTAAKVALDQEYRSTRIDPRWIYWWVIDWDERGEKEDPRPWQWKTAGELEVKDVSSFAKGFVDAPVIIAIVGDRDRVGLEELEEIGPVKELNKDQLFSYGKFPEAGKDKAPAKGKAVKKAAPKKAAPKKAAPKKAAKKAAPKKAAPKKAAKKAAPKKAAAK